MDNYYFTIKLFKFLSNYKTKVIGTLRLFRL